MPGGATIQWGEQWRDRVKRTVCLEAFSGLDNNFVLELLWVTIVIEGAKFELTRRLANVFVRLD